MGLTVGAIGIVATAQIQTEVQDSVNDEIATSAAQESRNVHSWDEQNRRSAKAIGETQSVRVGEDEQRISTVFSNWKNAIEGTGTVQEIYLVNLNEGRIQVSTDTDDRGQTLADTEAPWTTNLRQKVEGERDDNDEQEVYRSTAYSFDIGGGGSENVIAYVAEANPTQYVVYIVKLQDYYGTMGSSTTGQGTYIIDTGDGNQETILANSNGANILTDYDGDQSTTSEAVQRAAAGSFTQSGTLQLTGPPASVYDGGISGLSEDSEYVVGYSKVEGTNWVVLVHRSTGEAYGFVEQVQNYGYAATLGGVLLIGLVGAVLGRNTAASIDRLRTKTEQMEQGNLNVEFETQRIDNIGRLYGGLASMRDALRGQIQEARDAREEAELARAEAEQMTEHLEMKATEYQSVMQDVGEGNLTRRLDPESESQPMTDIAREFNEMIAEIEQTTEQLKNFANEVATSSEEVTASSEEVRSASEQVTESIQEISDGAERQNDQLQSVNSEMSGLSTTVEQIASSSNEVADLAERTAETGRDGRDAAEEAIDRMTTLEDEREVVTEQIRDLENEVEQIDELLEFITEIADQTNMLALNANIEAARSADSGGEGFGVVAQEVKDLAEETKDAAEDIEKRLGRIQDQTRQTAEGVEQTSEQIAGTTEAVRDAVDALDEIADYAQETNTGVQEISAATEQQAASTQEVVAMVDEAATISEETTAEAENVAAAAEEQTTALTEVSQSASDLAQQASRLSEALDRFDTDTDASFDFPMDDAEQVEEELSEFETDAQAAEEAVSEVAGETSAYADETGGVDPAETDPGFDSAAATFEGEAQGETADAGGDDFGSDLGGGEDLGGEDLDDLDPDEFAGSAAPDEFDEGGSAAETPETDRSAAEDAAFDADDEFEMVDDAEASAEPAEDAGSDADEMSTDDPDLEFEEGPADGDDGADATASTEDDLAVDGEAADGEEPLDLSDPDAAEEGEALEFGSADDAEGSAEPTDDVEGDAETADDAPEEDIDFEEELGEEIDGDVDAELEGTADEEDEEMFSFADEDDDD